MYIYLLYADVIKSSSKVRAVPMVILFKLVKRYLQRDY